MVVDGLPLFWMCRTVLTSGVTLYRMSSTQDFDSTFGNSYEFIGATSVRQQSAGTEAAPGITVMNQVVDLAFITALGTRPVCYPHYLMGWCVQYLTDFLSNDVGGGDRVVALGLNEMHRVEYCVFGQVKQSWSTTLTEAVISSLSTKYVFTANYQLGEVHSMIPLVGSGLVRCLAYRFFAADGSQITYDNAKFEYQANDGYIYRPIVDSFVAETFAKGGSFQRELAKITAETGKRGSHALQLLADNCLGRISQQLFDSPGIKTDVKKGNAALKVAIGSVGAGRIRTFR